MTDFQTVVDDGILLASQCRSVSKKAIDHVDVARNKRQAAFDRANHVEFSFGNRGPYAAVRPPKTATALESALQTQLLARYRQ